VVRLTRETGMCEREDQGNRVLCHAEMNVARPSLTHSARRSNLPDAVSHPLSDSRPSPIPEPLPQSTYDQFAQARPQRVRDGYSRASTIDERVGAQQVVGDRILVWKGIYDGEGTTGVGGLGYFDCPFKTVHNIFDSELADWSISALFVESDAVWAGLGELSGRR